MIYTTKEDGKTILWGMTTDDKDDAYETITDKNDVVIFRQVDTGKDFVYNEGEWYEFAESGGGGGGGVLVVSMSIVDGSFILDKTYGEIKNANYVLLKGNFVEGITTQGFIMSIEDIESGGDVCISLPFEDGDVYTLGKTVLHADTENDYPGGDVPE